MLGTTGHEQAMDSTETLHTRVDWLGRVLWGTLSENASCALDSCNHHPGDAFCVLPFHLPRQEESAILAQQQVLKTTTPDSAQSPSDS